MKSASNMFHALLLVVLLLVPAKEVCATITSGKVHLSGAKTESTLAKFSISSSSSAKIDLNLTSYGMYEDETELRLRIYGDDEWPRVRRQPLCSEKVNIIFLQ